MTIAPQRPPGLALDRLDDDYSAPPSNGPAPPPPQLPSQVSYYYDDDEGDAEPNEHGDSLLSHVPTSTATPVLPPSQYEVNLEQEIAELEKQLAENQARYQRLAVEGLVEIPVQGQGPDGATTKIVRLAHPPEEDEERMAELKKQIERSSATLLGGSPTLGFSLGRGGGGGGLAVSTPQGAAGAGAGDAGEGVEGGPLIQPPPTGLLSWLTERRDWAAWVDRRPGLSVLVAAFFILIGLGLAVMGFSTHDTQEVVTVPTSATGQNQSGANGTATAATLPTALPTATALPAPTPTPLPTPTLPPTTTKPPATSLAATVTTATTTTNQSQSQSQNQADLSWQPHGGYLPPRSLQIPALAVNVDRVVKAQSSLDTGAATGGSGSGSGSGKAWFTLSSPITGTLYHFGGYPGEAGTNLVLVGSYDTLGKTLEVLQQNDQVQVVNRQGGIYTYLLLSYPRLQAKLQSEAARGQNLTATTPTATVATNLTPLPTPTNHSAAAATPDERLTAAALAQRYSEDQLVQIAHKDDLDTLEVPGLTRASSTITLISLPPPGAPADERIVVRGILAFVKPASYTLPGTPVP